MKHNQHIPIFCEAETRQICNQQPRVERIGPTHDFGAQFGGA